MYDLINHQIQMIIPSSDSLAKTTGLAENLQRPPRRHSNDYFTDAFDPSSIATHKQLVLKLCSCIRDCWIESFPPLLVSSA